MSNSSVFTTYLPDDFMDTFATTEIMFNNVCMFDYKLNYVNYGVSVLVLLLVWTESVTKYAVV